MKVRGQRGTVVGVIGVAVMATVVATGARTMASPETVAAAQLTSSTVLYIPASAHATGSAGTNWRTDVEVHNADSAQVSYTFFLLKRDRDNSVADSRTYSLSPGRSVRYTDIVGSVFGFDGTAAIQVVTASAKLVVTSRTYNLLSTGTYGQFVRAQRAAEAIAYGSEGRIIQLSHVPPSAARDFRTNLGLVNATASTIAVTIDLYRYDQAYLGRVSKSLRAFEYQQIDGVFGQVTGQEVTDGYAIVSSTTPGSAFFAYASVVDNRSSDPIFITAEVVGAGGGTPPPGNPQYGPMIFSTSFNESTGTPLNPGTDFPYGATSLYGSWPYANVVSGSTFRYDWYRNGVQLTGSDKTFPNTSGSAWNVVYYMDHSPLDAGTYQLVIRVGGSVVLSGQCVISGAAPTPSPSSNGNLQPVKPSGWDYPIVPSSTTGTHTVGFLSAYYITYVDWAVGNSGSSTVPGPFSVDLKVDGQLAARFNYTGGGLAPGYYTYVNDYQLNIDTVGHHTLQVVADSTGVQPESNEGDNSWSGTWEWTSIVYSPPSTLLGAHRPRTSREIPVIQIGPDQVRPLGGRERGLRSEGTVR